MRGWIGLLAVAVLAIGCGGATDEVQDTVDPADVPSVEITTLSADDDGAAVLMYTVDDAGRLRIEIDWGDGSALQGFTGEAGTFTSQHVYDSTVTSAVVRVAAIDADGNTSTASELVDLVSSTSTTSPATTAPGSTVPETTASATTVADTVAPTTAATTTTARPNTTTTTSTTTTTTTTTLPPPRQYSVTVQGLSIVVRGDCDTVGGQGDFLMAGGVVAGVDDPAEFSFGSRSDTRQLGVGDSVSLADLRSQSSPVDVGVSTAWSASFAATEVDVGFDDPDMDGRRGSDGEVIIGPQSTQRRVITLGSGDCQVDMAVEVRSDFVP